MLINKSNFFSYTQSHKFIQLSSLRSCIATVNVQIKDLHLHQERQCLPSFLSKSERMKEISSLKNKISENLSLIEKTVHSFEIFPVSKEMKQNLKEYFTFELQGLLYKFRETQQSFLNKMSNNEIFQSFEEDIPAQTQVSSMHETKSTIFQVTTMLMELKMAVTAQTFKIDRIEFYLTNVNENMKKTNKELLQLPRKGVYFKNRIIYFLLFIVIVLMVLSLIKVSKYRKSI
ncbi:hypothetical protein H311_03922 [Anncaliia algerae PRA109]|nr:hypothetical protein H311_04232 [Anncaliia algerae PRA109]KCZ75106.1 hypothetical protein H311_03922 [Anncaliia algerae PRA109]